MWHVPLPLQPSYHGAERAIAMLVDKDAGQAPFCILWVSAVHQEADPRPRPTGNIGPRGRRLGYRRPPHGLHQAYRLVTAARPLRSTESRASIGRVSGKHLGGHGYVSWLPGSY